MGMKVARSITRQNILLNGHCGEIWARRKKITPHLSVKGSSRQFTQCKKKAWPRASLKPPSTWGCIYPLTQHFTWSHGPDLALVLLTRVRRPSVLPITSEASENSHFHRVAAMTLLCITRNLLIGDRLLFSILLYCSGSQRGAAGQWSASVLWEFGSFIYLKTSFINVSPTPAA